MAAIPSLKVGSKPPQASTQPKRHAAMKTFDLIKSDLYRYSGEYSFMLLLEQLVLNEGFNYMFWLRLARAASSRPVRLVLNHVIRLKQRRFGFVISPRTKIGPGFYISHVGSLVV